MKRLFFIVFVFFTVGVKAYYPQIDSINGNLIFKIDSIKNFVYSEQWKAVNPGYFQLIEDLFYYLEKQPVDSVVAHLRENADSGTVFFTRDISAIEEAEQVEGYVNAQIINNRLIEIENRIKDEMPLETITVPENEYVGMYSKLPLITHANIEQILADSIVLIPDTLAFRKLKAETIRNSSTRQKKLNEIDSLINRFVENARRYYNDSLISQYRDSISMNYRMHYRQNYIDAEKKKYTQNVAFKNYQVLRQYNDSVTEILNKEFYKNLMYVVDFVHTAPNQIQVFTLNNEKYVLPLQNENIWYQWLYLKNSSNDSIGIRVENMGRNSMKLLVDEAVNLSRLTQRSTIKLDQLKLEPFTEKKLSKVTVRKPEMFPWKFIGKFYSGLTQNYINQFWSKGGVSSASSMSNFNYDANYSKGKLKWENGIDAKIGFIYYIDENPEALRDWHKNSDNIEFNTRLGYSAYKEWYYSAEANFKTQFFLGYKSNTVESPNSAFMSPAYLTFSGGLDYKPNTSFSAFLSPLSVKTAYVLNPDVDETTFGLEEGETRKSRIGMSGRINYSKKILPNVSIRTRNNLFLNFGFKDGEWQFIKIPDFDTETSIDLKITRYITTQINFHLIYDKELTSKWTDDNGVEQSGTRLQVKEFVTFGLSYSF